MRNERGVTVIELVLVLAIMTMGVGLASAPAGSVVATLRAKGAAADLYGAVHRVRARARATGVMHALVIEPDGRGFRIVEDPAGAAQTVSGPHTLPEGAVATANTTIRFSPKGFAVPFGTITVRADDEVRRVIVNIVGRVRVAVGPPP